MPKNKVSDPITDQEIAFARLVLSGAMTDRRAAEAVGLNPDSAAYTKAKPRVRAYMLEHRAAVQRQLVQQEAEGLRRLNLDREQVLDRLWQIANLSPEMTRGSITGQVKALSMIVAIEGLIPDRRAGSSQKKSASPAVPQIDTAACPPSGVPDPPACPGVPWSAATEPALSEVQWATADPGPTPGPDFDSSEFIFARPFSPAETTPSKPNSQVSAPAADTWRLRL
jgi:hypothetical protein